MTDKIKVKGKRGETIKHLKRLGISGTSKMRGVKRQKEASPSAFSKALKDFREGKIDWKELKRIRNGEKKHLHLSERELEAAFYEALEI